MVVLSPPACGFDHREMKWKGSGAMGAQVSVRFTRLGLASASPVGPTAVCFASQGPSPALGVGDFREIRRKFWIIPISVPSVVARP